MLSKIASCVLVGREGEKERGGREQGGRERERGEGARKEGGKEGEMEEGREQRRE